MRQIQHSKIRDKYIQSVTIIDFSKQQLTTRSLKYNRLNNLRNCLKINLKLFFNYFLNIF